MKRVSVLTPVCALALVVAGVPPAPAGQPAERAVATTSVRTHVVAGAQDAAGYWTKDRMIEARPAPLPQIDGRTGRVALRAPASDEGPTFTRTEITNTTDPQYRMHGKVFFTDPFDGNDYVCSGTVATATNESLVWTAGHCVFLDAWHTNWVFVPAYRSDGTAPFGIWPALHTSAPERWVASNNIRQDVGIAIVDKDPVTGGTLQDEVGSRVVAFDGARPQSYSAIGYPADRSLPEFTGKREFACSDDYLKDDTTAGGTGPLPMAIDCDMGGGSSGGGWVGADGRLYSVNSYGYDDEPGVMYGPFLSDIAAALYGSAEALAVHPMSVGIRLKKHLVVAGTMTAADGYTSCAAGARVDVWRRGATGWSFVKAVRTNGLGRYSTKVKDKTGRYQVVAPDGPVDDGNYCSIAFSKVVRHRH